MATPAVGQRGAITISSGFVVPSAWLLLSDGWTGSLQMDMHEYLPHAPTNNAWQKVIGAIRSFSGSAEGTIDNDSNWVTTVIAQTTAQSSYLASFVLTLITGNTYSFSGFVSNLTTTNKTAEIERWSCNFEWDGASTFTIV